MIKVMLVDDESRVREAIHRLVPWEELGVSLIKMCSNAVEALHEMTEEMPEILITDIKMPIMNGIELIAKAKEMYPFLQCIIISGYDEFPLAKAAMMEGVKYYLLKPCMKEDIIAVLQKCIAEIDKMKRDAVSHCESREILIEKLMDDMRHLPLNRENPGGGSELKQLLSYYGDDRNLLQEAAAKMIVKYWSDHDSMQAMHMMRRLFDAKEDIYSCVMQILQEQEEVLHADGSFVMEAKKYIDKNYGQSNLSLQYVADHVVNMDVKYVGRKFQKELGIKFNDYLMKTRMECAIHMLMSGKDYRMYEIAEAVGLGNNVKYFYQLFKKYTGMTPAEYLETVKK